MKIKNLKGNCQHCGAPIEFRAETAGMTADCPHCGQPTELLLAPPDPTEVPGPTRAWRYAILALLILLAGLIACMVALHRAEKLSAHRKAILTAPGSPTVAGPTNPFAPEGFSVSSVALVRSQSGSIVHAVGKIHNLANRSRFGVRVELELRDGQGAKVGVAKDYQSILDPNAEWEFRALVLEKAAASAAVSAINEAQ